MAHHSHHEPASLLTWRRHQRPSAIMRPATFREIEREAEHRYGSKKRGRRAAGAAYWRSAAARFRRRRRAHHLHHR